MLKSITLQFRIIECTSNLAGRLRIRVSIRVNEAAGTAGVASVTDAGHGHAGTGGA